MKLIVQIPCYNEEEILATELMSQAVPGSKFYIVSRPILPIMKQ